MLTLCPWQAQSLKVYCGSWHTGVPWRECRWSPLSGGALLWVLSSPAFGHETVCSEAMDFHSFAGR